MAKYSDGTIEARIGDVVQCIDSAREFEEKSVRHVNWFHTEDAARTHEAWLNDGRGTDVYVAHYILASQPKEPGRE